MILLFVFGTLPAVLMPIAVAMAAILNTFTLVWALTYITDHVACNSQLGQQPQQSKSTRPRLVADRQAFRAAEPYLPICATIGLVRSWLPRIEQSL